ncbi:oxygen-dependent tRNA uridine(34) hydroxylase TrhO [Deinococcus radiophilus]|nr:rhodanese-related sulfurtransferase [Deinococcus radiophilus]UFA49797.1 rhodanese-related sulfurtransferase [Deinococcus radiophilus]
MLSHASFAPDFPMTQTSTPSTLNALQSAPAPSGEWVVAALYQFRAVPDAPALHAELKRLCTTLGLCGTLIVAPEGLNGTVAGSRDAITALHTQLLTLGFDRMEYKESRAPAQPFKRMKVRLKKEIVTLGVEVQPRELVGHYLDPEAWNDLLDDPDVVVIDTRNRYEHQAGTFEGALDPQTDSFREFPQWLDEHADQLKGKKVAMFCTGGIRCEKSTSLLLQRGYQDVFHLQGGILRYLEAMPVERSRWQGECFVFDERVTVGHGLQPGQAEMCWSCGWPLKAADRQHPHFERGVSCEHCYGDTTEAQKAAFRERQQWHDEQQGQGRRPEVTP